MPIPKQTAMAVRRRNLRLLCKMRKKSGPGLRRVRKWMMRVLRIPCAVNVADRSSNFNRRLIAQIDLVLAGSDCCERLEVSMEMTLIKKTAFQGSVDQAHSIFETLLCLINTAIHTIRVRSVPTAFLNWRIRVNGFDWSWFARSSMERFSSKFSCRIFLAAVWEN